MNVFAVLLVAFLMLTTILATTGFAGPPFLTDDPEPVPFKHWEFYVFSTVDATHKATNGTGPAFEFNVGALPNLQAHLVLPLAFTAPQDEPSAYGLGDMEFGLKYRFIQETDHRPMVGVFPLLEIPTGDAIGGWATPGLGKTSPLAAEELGTLGRPTGEAAMPSIPPQSSAATILAGGSYK